VVERGFNLTSRTSSKVGSTTHLRSTLGITPLVDEYDGCGS